MNGMTRMMRAVMIGDNEGDIDSDSGNDGNNNNDNNDENHININIWQYNINVKNLIYSYDTKHGW